MTLTLGFDLSKWQGSFPWPVMVNQPVEFCIPRAGNGLTVDQSFQANVDGARQNAMRPGAYHFFRPGIDAKTQADFLVSRNIPLMAEDIGPAIDVETSWPGNVSKRQREQQIAAFLQEVAQQLYLRGSVLDPIIYGSPGFFDENLLPDHQLGKWKLWVADYQQKTSYLGWKLPQGQPRLPVGWTDWYIWQYGQVQVTKDLVLDGNVMKE